MEMEGDAGIFFFPLGVEFCISMYCCMRLSFQSFYNQAVLLQRPQISVFPQSKKKKQVDIKKVNINKPR